MGECPLEKLQFLFRELFQLDLADLDFGLYRLFHLKRAEIEAFISKQLPREVDAAFQVVADEEREKLQAELDALARQIREQIAEDAILPTGEIKPEYLSNSAKVVRELAESYESIRQKVAAVQVADKDKADVFNYLYDFFKRYYEDGDFIPKRRYGAKETYAIPYNGEEVFFHWANRNQHYVKTAERFRDYAFKVNSLFGKYRVRFTITDANIPKDNTKGNTRYFFPRPDLASYDAEAQEFTLPFEYRLPTPEEAARYGNNSRAQEAILEEALPCILEAAPDDDLRSLLSQPVNENGDAPTLLQRRLRHFCRRNTSDYFIHKDLRGFLTRELEFYIKDQIIHLMDLEADLDAKRRMVKAFRNLAEKIIDFLATIEDAQKTLFEKKKFVLEVDYLIPVQHVPREFWPEILQNEDQLKEWQSWLALESEMVDEAFLEAHPTLAVHTKHFGRNFVWRLLEALPFEDVDEATDGLLVHGENYQALRLLTERYRAQVKCIYIDPPYNTGNDEFIYKDRYQHSSWLVMMEERLWQVKNLMRDDGAIFISIDDNEEWALHKLLIEIFGLENILPTVAVRRRKSQPNLRKGVAPVHDYLIIACKEYERLTRFSFVPEEFGIGTFSNPDNDPRGPWTTGPCSNRGGSKYKITTPAGVEYEDEWRFTQETYNRLLQEGRIYFPDSGRGKPRYKIYLSEKKEQGVAPSTWWENVGDTQMSHQLLEDMFGYRVFENPKPIELLERIVDIVTLANEREYVVDFFAGSGTTGHAVINLNREDDGQRKFILVEMGEYFDTVLLPRIAKVMYTPQWRNGKPEREATSEEAERTPRLVKILRLESYEDALHNLAAPSTIERVAKSESAYRQLVGKDAYRLYYWIELPLREAETCLRTFDLAHPFNYSLEVLTDDGPVRKPVDVAETFNYLYGLRVQRYETWCNTGDGDRKYRVVKAVEREGRRRILVLWRDATGLNVEVERAFLEEKINEMRVNGEVWDEILINGDSSTPGLTSLDSLFKRLMMQGEES